MAQQLGYQRAKAKKGLFKRMAESLDTPDFYTQMIIADGPMRSIQSAATTMGNNVKLYVTNKTGQDVLAKINLAEIKQQEDMTLQKMQAVTDVTKSQTEMAKQILANNEASKQFYNTNVPILQKEADNIASLIY